MRNAVVYTYVGFIILSLLTMFWFIPVYCPPSSGFGMPPATLPYALCIVMLVSSVKVIIRTIRSRQAEMDAPNPLPLNKWAHVLVFAIVCLCTMPLLRLIGFIPGGIIIMLALQLMCGQRNPLKLALISVFTIVIPWACMVYILAAPLP